MNIVIDTEKKYIQSYKKQFRNQKDATEQNRLQSSSRSASENSLE